MFMKIKSNFTLGLISGIGLSVALTLFMSARTDVKSVDSSDGFVDPYKGGYIGSYEADSLINQYANDWVKANDLPMNTTTGGYIGKSNLAQVASLGNEEEYIKFNFYYTKGENNEPQIGLMFYPSYDASAVLMTGSGSYCPTQCSAPGQ